MWFIKRFLRRCALLITCNGEYDTIGNNSKSICDSNNNHVLEFNVMSQAQTTYFLPIRPQSYDACIYTMNVCSTSVRCTVRERNLFRNMSTIRISETNIDVVHSKYKSHT